MRSRTTTHALAALAVMTSVSAVASAHGEDADYGLAIIDNQVAVGIGNHDTQMVTDFGERVFASEMTLTPGSWFADEPGIFIEAGSLPDNTQVSFTLTDALLYWDGTGPISFSNASNPLNIGFGPVSVSTSSDGSPVPGFSINYDADATDGFDEHFEFTINGAAAPGIYLLANTFSLSGAQHSVVIYTVFNAGLDEEIHDAAIDYVESTLVPAPGALSLLPIGALPLIRRRRRADA